MERYDVAIIGGGQAGVPLAYALPEAGKRTVLIERKHLGGSCINFGMTERQARESGREIKVARYEIRNNSKAVEIGEPDGFIKLVADAATGQLLGATVVCHEAAELVHVYVDHERARAVRGDPRRRLHPSDARRSRAERRGPAGLSAIGSQRFAPGGPLDETPARSPASRRSLRPPRRADR